MIRTRNCIVYYWHICPRFTREHGIVERHNLRNYPLNRLKCLKFDRSNKYYSSLYSSSGIQLTFSDTDEFVLFTVRQRLSDSTFITRQYVEYLLFCSVSNIPMRKGNWKYRRFHTFHSLTRYFFHTFVRRCITLLSPFAVLSIFRRLWGEFFRHQKSF